MPKEIQVRFKQVRENKNNPNNPLPTYATPGSAGLDLYACLENEQLILPGQTTKIPTGISMELPGPGVVALICARSGLAAKYGISLTNAVGVIDSDYRGEIQVLLINHGTEPFTVHHGDRIAQMLFVPVYMAKIIEAEELQKTQRGSGGFGSTGI